MSAAATRWLVIPGMLACGLAAGCSFAVPAQESSSAFADGGGDVVEVLADACVSFSQQLDTCMVTPGADLALDGAYQLDTDTGVLTLGATTVVVDTSLVVTTTNHVEVRVLSVGQLTFAMGAKLRATGTRSLAIVARGAISLPKDAQLDVSGGGAGARTTCPNGPTAGADSGSGAAGGGGGGFGSAGAAGGNGNNDGTQSAGGAAGALVALPGGPLGGCAGAGGGVGGDAGGFGGLAGGAIYAVSTTSITLAGGASINAGGGGGQGGRKVNSQYGDAGGGGGGSGGMVLLEAPIVHSAGALAANGGGAGEGSGNGSAGKPGDPGGLGGGRANGGSGGSPTGTDGGKGGASSGPADSPSNVQNGGGGGGGGGVGFIHVVAPDLQLGAMVSPPAS